MEETVIRGTILRLSQGDITSWEVDAVVNAANSTLMGGGGVDGAIHRAGGPEILEACKAWVRDHGELPTGQAMITTAGQMPAKAVVHTVGPIYKDGQSGEAASLESCFQRSLLVALEHGHRSVAFPAISTGVYGYPAKDAAGVAIEAIQKTLLHEVESGMFREIHIVLFDEASLGIWKEALERFVYGDDDEDDWQPPRPG